MNAEEPILSDKDIYAKMIDVLDKKGWCQKDNVNHDGQVCLNGALWSVQGVRFGPLFYWIGLDPELQEPHRVAWHYLEKIGLAMYPDRGDTLVAINDHQDTTVEDVKLILKQANEQAQESQ